MQLFVPIILQYCRSYCLISRFDFKNITQKHSKVITTKLYQEKKEGKKSQLFIFFIGKNIRCYWIIHFYMSDTEQNFSTLLLKCFLRNCKYVYLNINMYTSTLKTSVMYVDGLLLLLRFFHMNINVKKWKILLLVILSYFKVTLQQAYIMILQPLG